jgi:hypothetical protein
VLSYFLSVQVKKEILDKLGLDASPGTPPVLWMVVTRNFYVLVLNKYSHYHITCFSVKSKKTKGITTYFSKRCLPPEEAVSALSSSPELRLKSRTNNAGTELPQTNQFPKP